MTHIKTEEVVLEEWYEHYIVKREKVYLNTLEEEIEESIITNLRLIFNPKINTLQFQVLIRGVSGAVWEPILETHVLNEFIPIFYIHEQEAL